MHTPPSSVACKVLPPNKLTEEKPSIKIIDHVIKEGGVFSSTTINFVIETKPVGWKVQRTYSEVMWLREQLAKEFPTCFVIPSFIQ